jgi:branched-chain amino acid transport system ATP-binding protein
MTEPILQVRRLSKHFGGVVAVHDVSLSVAVGELHAVIGPNGAGKTTLINMLSGDLAPSAGSILFDDREIAHLPPERRSAWGISRSYQRVNIFTSFTALENCRLAAQSRAPRPLNWLRDARTYRDVTETAYAMLAAVGLSERAEALALTLSHGEQRQLEIALSLATTPKLLLLDEPLAGLGTEESARMVQLISGLQEKHAVLLVEHDMDAVFQLATVLTVMLDGEVLACGRPDAVRASRDVQSAYLGVSVTPR